MRLNIYEVYVKEIQGGHFLYKKSKELAYIIFKNIFKIKIMIEYSPRYSSEPLILISKLTVWISQNQEPELNHLRPVPN